jgi:hypothetical protein
MTIQQTVEIPAGKPVNYLHLEVPLPEAIPSGMVNVEVTVRPGKKKLFGNLFASKFYKHFDEFYGCLRDSGVFEGDSVETVRRMRDEWDRPLGRNVEV